MLLVVAALFQLRCDIAKSDIASGSEEVSLHHSGHLGPVEVIHALPGIIKCRLVGFGPGERIAKIKSRFRLFEHGLRVGTCSRVRQLNVVARFRDCVIVSPKIIERHDFDGPEFE